MIDTKGIKVLVSRVYPNNAVKLLNENGFTVTTWNEDRPMTSDELLANAKKHNALLCTITEKIDKEFLHECSHLDIISQYAVGYDNIDVAEATKLGIPIGNTPDALSKATADISFGLMIATARKMIHLHKTILNGEWSYFKPTANLGIELENKILGIFGLGRIGIEMAKRCKGAYNMDIIYHNRKQNIHVEKPLNAKYVDFDTLLEKSDILSVHCSLNEETKGIFNKQSFAKMKPTSIFINTSRGLVHNEVDLIEACNNGQIWGAGLDVTNPEPMEDSNPLLSMENITVLPHVGSGTVEARGKMAELAANNIIEFYLNKHIPHLVNPEVFDR